MTIMKGSIVEIKRFAVHDGPGIRTTVFLKGCPLKCRWCHNPESISVSPELAYIEKKCLNCGGCVEVCPSGAHRMTEGRHYFDRDKCTVCGRCADICPGNALLLYGREMSAEQVMRTVLEDKDFYETSGGGITLSGGEPLMQSDFCVELLESAKHEGIDTAMDTCGAVPWMSFEKVLPATDLILFDVKHMNPTLHKEYTGADNRIIQENLRRLSEYGADIEVRIPLIPGFNDDEESIRAFSEYLAGLPGIRCVKILPYHSLARSKYHSLGKEYSMPRIDSPSDGELRRIVARMSSFGVAVLSGKE